MGALVVHQPIVRSHLTPKSSHLGVLHLEATITRALKDALGVFPFRIVRAVPQAALLSEAVQHARALERKQLEDCFGVHGIICRVKSTFANEFGVQSPLAVDCKQQANNCAAAILAGC